MGAEVHVNKILETDSLEILNIINGSWKITWEVVEEIEEMQNKYNNSISGLNIYTGKVINWHTILLTMQLMKKHTLYLHSSTSYPK